MILSRRSFCLTGASLFAFACGDNVSSDVEIWGYRGRKPGLFASPRGIAVSQEHVYVIDRTGRVQVFDHQGTFLHEWVLPKIDNGTPTGITIGPDGNIWIPDTHISRILAYDTKGNLLQEFGEYGEEAGKFIYPTDLTFGDQGEIFVAEYGTHDRIQVFTPEGTYIRGWGDFGDGPEHFNRPMAVVKGPDGLLYIADSVNHRIKVYTQQGELVRILGQQGTGPGEFDYPYDLDFDAQGNLLVCEFGNNRVQQLTPAGEPLQLWGQRGGRPGELAEPWGLAYFNERIYVLDTRNNRIAIFTGVI